MADKEYIEREAVEKYIESLYQPWEHRFQDRDNIKRQLKRIPAADVVEVRYGEWKYNENGGYVCSECDCWLEDYYGATPQMMRYCFHCGAKMDGTVC